MNFLQDSLEGFLAREHRVVIVDITAARGSAPRDQGTFMLVAPTEIHGTIGGGQLEYVAIENARKLLAEVGGEATLDIPLGPEIGQCCGGRVELAFTFADEEARRALDRRRAEEERLKPQVWVFGAGHVGRALAEALTLLPLKVFVVEARETELDQLTSGVHHRLAAMPEALIADIPAGSAIVIVTHDHALDFLIGRQALERRDLAYIGMVGSKSKRGTFLRYLEEQGVERGEADRLVLPIGGNAVDDKRPEVIAAMTASEVLLAFAQWRKAA
ncbi:xanthine dehydrogenase accessory protein XdhC [Shinella curvata]|uniref:Xanthine dehydrogenase accessory protein XdhC n=1 Tax=Shinella curvata TaxID=1817964 RepID=A0ABT8XJ96_9HYPH|nr:xanthine dehydrogenase accessory protein XdhC [Shinella curvata]MCJ8052727.1 xanthine dehydrogenase accessory protein XdhC [Shinella curvata]MDO6123807.1 xanthine dehydrogenase accessory protein XdhC [Shinella curvata]